VSTKEATARIKINKLPEAAQPFGEPEKLSFDVDSLYLVRQKEPMKDPSPNAQSYSALLKSIKERIQMAQVRAAVAVNLELVRLYWGIGKEILARQHAEGWGTKVIERLAKDLCSEFPQMKGLSRTNLLYMRAFSEAWPEEAIVQQVVGQIPWGHNVRLLDLVKDRDERLWYARAAIEHGWSRNVLVIQIEAGLYRRQGKAITNFTKALPADQSDLAQQLLKDPYNFDFLTLSKDADEREVETGLVAHIQKFLLELGTGFAFVGRQYPLEIAGDDYRLDLLFYHLKLRCFMVIDLKTGPFKPEYAGKMNFYLAAVDGMLKHPSDNPTIGLILCKSKKELVVEYALRNTATPMGIAEFKHLEQLPAELKGSLPTIEEIEAELGRASEN
jgi:predicted nuclease of restriction endonuclease-like (RecB) superfamily